MGALIDAIFYILGALINLATIIVFAYVLSTWLINFDVINVRNRIVYQVVRFLEAVTLPMLRPFRRFIPLIGGFDISPVILLLVLGAVSDVLLPRLHLWLLMSVAGGP